MGQELRAGGGLLDASAALLRDSFDWSRGGDGEFVWQRIRASSKTLAEADYATSSPAWQQALADWCMAQVAHAHGRIAPHVRDGVLRAWREISAMPHWRPDQGRHPGLYWSWDERAAEAHWGGAGGGKVAFLLCADLRSGDIDWPVTLAMNANPDYAAEREIRVAETSQVKLVSAQRRWNR